MLLFCRTAVPWSYSRHTSRFLTLWCGTLPLALVPLFGWLTIPVVMVICWCLFGIEEIGHLIEQPFVSDDIVESQKYLTKERLTVAVLDPLPMVKNKPARTAGGRHVH